MCAYIKYLRVCVYMYQLVPCLPIAGELEFNDLQGLFQHKPFYNSVILWGVPIAAGQGLEAGALPTTPAEEQSRPGAANGSLSTGQWKTHWG